MVFFFFKQKTAYDMRISDWSSDVCSSDLLALVHEDRARRSGRRRRKIRRVSHDDVCGLAAALEAHTLHVGAGGGFQDRPSDFSGAGEGDAEIGRASCRDRVCQYV